MALSAFDDKSKQPLAGDLKETLGRTGTHWDSLIAHIAAEYAPLEETWNYSGKNWTVVAPTETEETYRPVYDAVQGSLLGRFRAGREGGQGSPRYPSG